MLFPSDTIAAIATPPGEGAIAIIRLSGPDTFVYADQVFRSKNGKLCQKLPGYSVTYGKFVSSTGEEIDDGLITLFRSPHSYTGEDAAEISCHGGTAVVARLFQAALYAGARPAEPGEFTLRAFLNGKMDLARAEAVADLIRARSDSAARAARRQLEGSLSIAIHALREEIISIIASIEVTIDFSEEVGELDYSPLLTRIQSVLDRTEKLLKSAKHGRQIREGIKVTLIGRPNSGKSSLMNRLLETERAIVTPHPGTTRDLLEESLAIRGINFVLTDTAGIRNSEDTVENIGIERARQSAALSDMILFIVDAEAGIGEEERSIAALLTQSDAQVMCVINKCDLVSDELSDLHKNNLQILLPKIEECLVVSAVTDYNITLLKDAITRFPGLQTIDSSDFESGLITSERHKKALQNVESSLQQAVMSSIQQMPGDFISIDLRAALDSLGLITGETVTDEIIHKIFHDFCVGK